MFCIEENCKMSSIYFTYNLTSVLCKIVYINVQKIRKSPFSYSVGLHPFFSSCVRLFTQFHVQQTSDYKEIVSDDT
jgi:hypothetical protein